MPSEHTRERLRVVSGMIETESGIPIAHMDREPGNGTSPVERDDTAHRIVLAYNSHKALVEACKNLRKVVDIALDQSDNENGDTFGVRHNDVMDWDLAASKAIENATT